MSRFHLSIVALIALASPAQAAREPAALSLALEMCACDTDRETLNALHARIAAAPDVDSARELARTEVRIASAALGQAERLMPWSRDLGAARERLARYEAGLALADSPAGAAAEFSTLMRLDPSQAQAATCDYSTGEIIAIVLGFILGIIPGIILLILLC